MLTGNAQFPVPYPSIIVSLAQLIADIDDYDNAITDNETHADGTSEAMRLAGEIVHSDLISIMAMVQAAMDLDKPNAILTATNAGYDTKTQSIRGPRKANCFRGEEPGELIVWGEGAGPHDWQESLNGGVTVQNIPGTKGGIKTVTGLISDKRYWYRSRTILPGGSYGEWSEWVSEVAP
ncbi:MAG: hypothetical protein WCH34_00955 [Bacteroidota bacterium]